MPSVPLALMFKNYAFCAYIVCVCFFFLRLLININSFITQSVLRQIHSLFHMSVKYTKWLVFAVETDFVLSGV
jgi:hypothetical protein